MRNFLVGVFVGLVIGSLSLSFAQDSHDPIIDNDIVWEDWETGSITLTTPKTLKRESVWKCSDHGEVAGSVIAIESAGETTSFCPLCICDFLKKQDIAFSVSKSP